MERWRTVVCDPRKNEGARLFLANSSKTIVLVNRRLTIDPREVFKKMEELGVPFRYTNGLKCINFTILKGPVGGYYYSDQIDIHASSETKDHLDRFLVHEVGHHVDDQEVASDGLESELKRHWRKLHVRISSKTEDEYLASGFEKFYAMGSAARKEMAKTNPKLYSTIMRLHRSYRSRG